MYVFIKYLDKYIRVIKICNLLDWVNGFIYIVYLIVICIKLLIINIVNIDGWRFYFYGGDLILYKLSIFYYRV